MDNREDLARISIDTLQEWTLIKSNYLNAAVVRLDALLKAKDINSAESRDRCLIRINEVRRHGRLSQCAQLI